MTFYTENPLIIDDRRGDLHHFTLRDHKIIYMVFNRNLGKVDERTILKNATNDFDASVNSAGEIYFICKDQQNRIALLSNHRDFDHIKYIITPHGAVQNINIVQMENIIHILYHEEMVEEEGKYQINHYYDDGHHQEIQEIGRIHRGDVLNPLQCTIEKDKILLTYFDLVSGVEQLFLKIYSAETHEWSRPILLTKSREKKLYQNVLLADGKLHVTYCEYSNGNLLVKYEKYHSEEETYRKTYEYALSNPGNCSHPILILHDNLLWLCWTEFNYIASRYSSDQGKTWNDIYLWDESRMEDILLFKYITNQETSLIGLNYSFGRAKDLQFIGFGSLEHTSIIPWKGREMYKMDETKAGIHDVDKEGEEKGGVQPEDFQEILPKEIPDMERQFKRMEDRLSTIEEFLMLYTKKFKDFKK